MRDRDLTQTMDEQFERRENRALDRSDQLAIGWIVITLVLMAAGWTAVRQMSGNGWIPRQSAAPRMAVFQVDVNQAQWPEIAALPQVGERLARDIVAWRQKHGPFSRLDELAMIYGIGNATLDRVAPYVALPRGTTSNPVIARHSVSISGQTR